MIPNTHLKLVLTCTAVMLSGLSLSATMPGLEEGVATLSQKSTGVVIHKVVPKSPAQAAGLQSGDILKSWRQGREQGRFEHWYQVTDIAREYAPRGPIFFNVLRNGQEQRIRVKGTFYWGLRLRPFMDPQDLQLYRAGESAKAQDTQIFHQWMNHGHHLRQQQQLLLSFWFYEKALTRAGRNHNWSRMNEAAEAARAVLTQINIPNQLDLRLDELQGWLYGRGQEFLNSARLLEHTHKQREALNPNGYTLASSNMRLGRSYRDAGKIAEAEHHLRAAVSLADAVNPNSLYLARALTKYGDVLFALGDLKGADLNLTRGYEMARNLDPESSIFAQALHHKGRLAFAQQKFRRSQEFFLAELELRHRLSPNSDDHFSALNGLGAVAFARKDLNGAMDHFRQAVALLEKEGRNDAYMAKVLGNLAHIEIQNQHYPEAQEALTRAVGIMETIAPDHPMLTGFYYGLGDVMLNQGDKQKALTYYQTGMDHVEHLIASFVSAEDVRAAFSATQRRQFGKNVDLLLDMGKNREAFNVMERYHARVFMQILAERDLVFNTELDPESAAERTRLEQAAIKIQRKLDHLEFTDERRRPLMEDMRNVRNERARLFSEVKDSMGVAAVCRAPEPMTFDQVRAQLPENTLMLSYMVQDDAAYVFAVSAHGALEAKKLSHNGNDLNVLVQDFRRFLIKPDSRTAATMLNRKSETLYKTLIEPVSHLLSYHDHLVLIPDGALRQLPFAALRNPRGKRYLIEEKSFAVWNSASVQNYLTNRGQMDPEEDEEEEKPTRWFAFGNPSYVPVEDEPVTVEEPEEIVTGFLRSSKNLHNLDYSQEEVDYIYSLNANTEVYKGSDASETKVREHLDEDAALIHFSCHGYYDEEYPLNSALALSSEGGGKNGYLHAWEIMDNFSLNADLVVLAACESAISKDFGAEGMYGLSRAFQYAGARAVVASLWRVSDLSTAYLMKNFYDHLDQGLPKDKALRKAQLKLIEHQQGRFNLNHPFYWAGFQLHGDSSPLSQR